MANFTNFNQVFKLALTAPISFTASSLEWAFGKLWMVETWCAPQTSGH